jgi:predicted ATP-dependent protease
MVLALPHGTGAAFAEALGTLLAALVTEWKRASSSQLVTQFGALAATAPVQTTADAQTYLVRLKSALQAALDAAPGDGDDAPFDADSVPVLHVSLPSDEAAGAPVVVATAGTDQAEALLRANGGVLIIHAGSVDIGALIKALRSRSLAVKDDLPPLPLSTRVVVVGGARAYDNMWSEEFAQVFRYEAWGTDFTAWTREAEATYAAFAIGVAARYGLPLFDPSGVARLVEEGARRTSSLQRSRLTTNLQLLHDLAYESGRIAQTRGIVTSGAEVDAALLQRRRPHLGFSRIVREAILSGENMTPTSGTAVGQINGLGILSWFPDESAFAVPLRISATVSSGREEQLIDIEREAEVADSDHVRGELTVEGYLVHRYGRERPLAFAGRLRFEQEHRAIGGDSASAAILLTLLSALGDAPIRRSIAVTGAVGQYGEIQPVGGVNIKIEGFWELAQARRAQGEQSEGGYGVVIPQTNARDVMLRREVAHSIAGEGWFRLWTAGTVDEMIPLVMGIPADVLHKRVEARLARFAQIERKRGGR